MTGQYQAPSLPEGYRFRVWLYAGEILTVTVQQYNSTDPHEVDWQDTHHTIAVGSKTARGVREAMEAAACGVHKVEALRPLLGTYSPGDPI